MGSNGDRIAKPTLPAWFSLLQALWMTGLGSWLIVHTASDAGGPNALLLGAGLALVGLAPKEFVDFLRGVRSSS